MPVANADGFGQQLNLRLRDHHVERMGVDEVQVGPGRFLGEILEVGLDLIISSWQES
jgi:hypothetical protein